MNITWLRYCGLFVFQHQRSFYLSNSVTLLARLYIDGFTCTIVTPDVLEQYYIWALKITSVKISDRAYSVILIHHTGSIQSVHESTSPHKNFGSSHLFVIFYRPHFSFYVFIYLNDAFQHFSTNASYNRRYATRKYKR